MCSSSAAMLEKYWETRRELETLRQRISTEYEDEVERLESAKRSLEKKVCPLFHVSSSLHTHIHPPHAPSTPSPLSHPTHTTSSLYTKHTHTHTHTHTPPTQLVDSESEKDDLQRNLNQVRKKAAKVASEMNDLKLHLETQQARNAELEKRQRK